MQKIWHSYVGSYFSFTFSSVGLYPTPSTIKGFKEVLSGYKGAKGSVQFPHDKPIPYDLIKKIVKFRLDEISTSKNQIKKKY